MDNMCYLLSVCVIVVSVSIWCLHWLGIKKVKVKVGYLL